MFLVPTLISPPPTTSFDWFNSIHCSLYSHSTKRFDLRFDLHHGSHWLSAMAGAACCLEGKQNQGLGNKQRKRGEQPRGTWATRSTSLPRSHAPQPSQVCMALGLRAL